MQLGKDDWGQRYLENLGKFNVCTTHVEKVDGKSTGFAHINVSETGENQIVIVPGASDTLTPADIEKAQDLLGAAKVRFVFSY